MDIDFDIKEHHSTGGRRKPKCSHYAQNVMVIDLYKRPFYFLMPDRTEYYRNYLGTCLSFFTLFLVLVYGFIKFGDLMEYKDYKVFEIKEENYFKDSDKFTSNDGFNIAAGIFGFEENFKEDPEVGTVKFYLKFWDTENQETHGAIQFKEVKTRPCQISDFNDPQGSNSESRFYASDYYTYERTKNFSHLFKCLDNDEELTTFGSYDTNVAANLMIVFEKCDESVSTCKSKEEIE